MVPLSILDLAPIVEGGDAADALRRSLDLARHAERWGYRRYWVAEHHNMKGIASAATSVVIGHLAGGTSTIRVGAGGIMLPNHSPLVIAEQFGTLEALYPGRIDLGLGRAPGTDHRTWRALRREADAAERFPQDVLELQALLGPLQPDQVIQAVPGTNTNVPLWILGSSLFGSQLAAVLGLPYAFASHFSPDALMDALSVYRERFQPSAQLAESYVIAGTNAIVAPTDDEARFLFSSSIRRFAEFRRPGNPGLLKPPVENIDDHVSPMEKMQAMHMLRYAAIGSPETVRPKLEEFAAHARAGIEAQPCPLPIGVALLVPAGARHDIG